MRLFIVLSLPAAERERLHAATRPLREADLPVRWVDLDSLHLTLKFLGEVRPEHVDEVGETLLAVTAKQSPFRVPLAGFGALPTLRRPRIVWARAEPVPELRFLKHDLEWGLAELGFEREDRAFHPHITLGRAQRNARAGDFRALEGLLRELRYDAVLDVSAASLYRSTLLPEGARYESLLEAPLTKVAARSGAHHAGGTRHGDARAGRS